MCLSLCLSQSLSLCVSISLSVFLSFSLSACLSHSLSLPVSPFIYSRTSPCGLSTCTSLGFLKIQWHQDRGTIYTAARSSSSSIPESKVETASSGLCQPQTPCSTIPAILYWLQVRHTPSQILWLPPLQVSPLLGASRGSFLALPRHVRLYEDRERKRGRGWEEGKTQSKTNGTSGNGEMGPRLQWANIPQRTPPPGHLISFPCVFRMSFCNNKWSNIRKYFPFTMFCSTW